MPGRAQDFPQVTWLGRLWLRQAFVSRIIPRLCLASLSFNGDCLVFGPRHFLCILFVSAVNKNKETNSFRIFYN